MKPASTFESAIGWLSILTLLNEGSVTNSRRVKAMETVQNTTQTPSTQGIPASTPQSKPAATGGEFDQTLKAFIAPNEGNKVSEEELFSALVQERIKKTQGDGALGEFTTVLNSCKSRMRKADGYVPVEEATKQALIEFKEAKKISQEEVDKIYSESFAAAQLDENKEALFDGRGGANDPTIAVASMEQALLLSRAKIESFDSGTAKADIRSISEAATGKAVGTAGSEAVTGTDAGFLFKPTSESDGKLVVLLPARLTGLVSGLSLIGPDGQVLESGRYRGVGNGGREHFRFSKPGGQYPNGSTVQAKLVTGEIVRYLISNTSQRTENTAATGEGDATRSSTGPSSTSGTNPPSSSKTNASL